MVGELPELQRVAASRKTFVIQHIGTLALICLVIYIDLVRDNAFQTDDDDA